MLEYAVGLAWSGAGVSHTSWSAATVNAVSAVGALAIAAWVAYLAECRHRELQRQRAAKVVPFAPRASARVVGALIVLLCAWPATSRAGEEPPAADAAPRLKVAGFVDAVFARNFNRPADHANFLPGLGTSAKRDNELAINLAQVDLVLAPEPVGFKLSLGFGTAPEVVHWSYTRSWLGELSPYYSTGLRQSPLLT